MALARAVVPGADEERVLAGSGGNPLFAIELSRAATADGTPPCFAVHAHRRPSRTSSTTRRASWSPGLP